MANDRDLESEAEELAKQAGALQGRLQISRQFMEAWDRADDHCADLRAVSVAVARVDPKDRSVDPEPQARMAAHARELISAIADVETLALQLAGSDHGPRRAETLMTSINGSLAAATELLEGLTKIEDLELRRLSGVLAERVKGIRLAFAELERYHKRVYGGSE